MSTLSWMTRVRAFFGSKPDAAPAVATEAAWTGPAPAMAMVGTAVADAPRAAEATASASPTTHRPPSPAPASAPEPPPARETTPPGNGDGKKRPSPRIDPLDPPWMEGLEALPALGRALQGHRETGEALLRTVRQLPELTSDQTDHIVQTNRLLERQNMLLSSMLDTMSGLAASMRTMEESSRRHLTAIGTLEASHREVLFGYQAMLEKSHRRLGRLATLATVLAAVALGAAAWVVYLAIAAG